MKRTTNARSQAPVNAVLYYTQHMKHVYERWVCVFACFFLQLLLHFLCVTFVRFSLWSYYVAAHMNNSKRVKKSLWIKSVLVRPSKPKRNKKNINKRKFICNLMHHFTACWKITTTTETQHLPQYSHFGFWFFFHFVCLLLSLCLLQCLYAIRIAQGYGLRH